MLRSHNPPLAAITRANYVIYLRRMLEELAWTQQLPALMHLLGRDDVPRKEHRLPRPLTLEQDQVVVYCLHHAGPLAGRLGAAGIPVVAFRKAPGFSPGTVLAMARRLRSDRADVVHGHNPGVHHLKSLQVAHD